MELFCKITDSISKKPVEKAKITLSVKNEEASRDSAEELVKELAVRITGIEGTCEHKEETHYLGDTLIYSIEKDGYKPLKGSIKIEGVKVTLDKELIGDDIEVKLRLKDEFQNPLENVKIDLVVDRNKVGDGSSDKDGFFKTTLSPEYNGKELSYNVELTGFEAASGKILLQKSTYQEITMKKSPEFNVFGTINDGAKMVPIPGAKICLYIGDKELPTISSDSQGKFHYEEKGVQYLGETLRYKVEKEGYEPSEGTRKIEHEKIPLEVELTPESPSLELTFKDKNGNPLKDVEVTLELEGKQVKVGVSDENGLFKVTLSPDFKDKSLSYKAEIADFEVASGEFKLDKKTSREITMVRTPVTIISGKVEDTAGKPLAGADVSLYVGDKELAVLRSDGNGEFKHEVRGDQYVGKDLKYKTKKDGYAPKEGSVKVQEGGARLAVTLSPVSVPTPVSTPTPTPTPKPLPIIPIVAGVLVVAIIIAIWIFTHPSVPPSLLPTIDKFETSSQKIVGPYGNTTLSWAVSNAESVFINSEKVGLSGSKIVNPVENTTYTLVAESGNKKVDKEITIVVVKSAVEVKPNVTIDNFDASPNTININEDSTLSWTVSNAESVSLNGEKVGLSGSKTVSPKESTTYTLVAESGDKKVNKEITITVVKPKVTIDNFDASPNTININEDSTLSWTVSNAESVSLNGEKVGLSGSKTVSPKESTTYTLVAQSGDEKVDRDIMIVVVIPAPVPTPPTINRFSANPEKIHLEEYSRLSWDVSNAVRAELDHGFGNVPPSSGEKLASPAETTTYTLTAWNDHGDKATKSVTVVVETPPAIYSTGSLAIPQTWMADLDKGVVDEAGADIWFEAVTETERYLVPESGAKIAKLGTSPVGLEGCMAAPLSSSKIDINDLPEGTYVCVLTNEGRYSQLRVTAPVGPSPGTLNIDYTTWEKVTPTMVPIPMVTVRPHVLDPTVIARVRNISIVNSANVARAP